MTIGPAVLVIASLVFGSAADAVTLRVGASSRPIGLGNPYDSISTLGSHSRSQSLAGKESFIFITLLVYG